jgi:WD40 repeat protein
LWWDTAPLTRIGQLYQGETEVSALAVDPAGKTLAVAEQGGVIRLLDLPELDRVGEPLRGDWVGPAGPVHTLTFDRTSNELFIACPRGAQRAATKLESIGPYLRGGEQITSAARSPDGKLLALSTSTGKTYFYNARTGQRRAVVEGPAPREADSVTIFSPDSRWLLTHANAAPEHGDRQSGTWLWDLSRWPPQRSRQLLKSLRAAVHQVAFRPDGRHIVIGCSDGTARLWDVALDRQVGRPLRHASAVLSVAWSPAGDQVLAGCRDASAHLWSIARRKESANPLMHIGPVPAVAFSPAEAVLLTGTLADGARLWDWRTGAPLGPALRHRHGVQSVCFSYDGKFIASGDGDGTVRLWQVRTAPPTGTPRQIRLWIEASTGLARGQGQVMRVLSPAEVSARQDELRRSGWKAQ